MGTDLIVGAAPPERAGAASAVSETGAEFGGAVGIAILGSLGTAAYRNTMAGAVPIGVPPEVTATARDTLGGAVAMAERLPHPLGAELLDTARGAFTQAFELSAVVGIVVAMATAIGAAILLRSVRPHSAPEPTSVVGSPASRSSFD